MYYIKSDSPPVPEKIKKELVTHGHRRRDDYFWLRDRDDPKVLSHLYAENEYTERILNHTKSLQIRLYREMVERIKQTDVTVPYEENGYFYYMRYREGREYPLYCRKRTLESPEEVMLDANEMAKGHSLYKVVGTYIDPTDDILAFIVDTTGSRQCTICFKQLSTGKVLEDVLSNASERLAWGNDGKTVFYSINDETVRSHKIMRHKLGEPVVNDAEVYHEEDSAYSIYVKKSKSKRFIFIRSESTLSSEMKICEADSPDGIFRTIRSREPDVLYDAEHAGDRFYILTNDSARNFRLMEAPQESPAKETWRDLIPHREDVLIEGFEVFDDFLVVQERKDGLPQFNILNMKDKKGHHVKFPEESYFTCIGENRRLDSDVFRFYYTSLTTPLSTFDYNMRTGEMTLMKETEIHNYDKGNYETRRVFAEALDGRLIPISLVYRSDTRRDGTNPLLLYAYGSYGATVNPAFMPEIVSLLARGFIYAIAHVRGGQEMGRRWYEGGKMMSKKNTFTDFLSCAEYLIEEGYTNSKMLCANGKSAGGLLMGAIANMRPELFCSIIAEVPWVDVITDMLDADLPLTTLEYDEWGNPHRKEYYDYMLSYSPYDNVERREYPSILATGSLNDTQVSYWNPAKWVAKLREMNTGKNIILLKMNMGAGHSGASGRFEKYELAALKYAFLCDLMGISE
jgi:oligopeptidase B